MCLAISWLLPTKATTSASSVMEIGWPEETSNITSIVNQKSINNGRN